MKNISEQISEAEKAWNNLPSIRRAHFEKHQEIDKQLDEIAREPMEREEPDDPVAEHDEREWQIAIDNRIE